MNVTVRVQSHPPEHLDTDAREEVVGHSIETTTGALCVTSVMDEPPPLPLLTPYGPGTYRLRIHARGRDIAPDAAVHEPTEDHLLIIWPDQARPDEIHKQTDTYGAQLRATPDRPASAASSSAGIDEEHLRLIRAKLQER